MPSRLREYVGDERKRSKDTGLQGKREKEQSARARLYYNLFPARCSYEYELALVVRTSSRVVRTLFVRCSYAVRTLFASLFVRCSYERELTRELRSAPVCVAYIGPSDF